MRQGIYSIFQTRDRVYNAIISFLFCAAKVFHGSANEYERMKFMAKKVILYGTSECPPCVETKKRFDEEGIHYGYVDVLASLAHLKKFMNLRDANPEIYKEIVEHGSVGIPTVVVDDTHFYVKDVPNVDIALFK